MSLEVKVKDLTTSTDIHNPDALYEVYRGNQKSESLVTYPEVLDFLDACGIKKDDERINLILRGVPFEIDGLLMRFAFVENEKECVDKTTKNPNEEWADRMAENPPTGSSDWSWT